MPLLTSQGSLLTPSSRESNPSLRPELQPDPVLDEQALLKERTIKKTFLNNTAVNEDQFKNDLSMVAGFPEGRIIKVTYFSTNSPMTDIRSKTVDMLTEAKDRVHISYTQIRNFELRLSTEISFNYDNDKTTSEVKGEALVLAGFEPLKGDLFLYEVRNGKIGIFTISSVVRTALGQDTYHKVTFTMKNFADATMVETYRKQSAIICYFDKTKFLVGNHAMLSTQGYIDQKELQQLKREITQNYLDRFYDKKVSSFMRPDGLFDPYVVEYWNSIVSVMDTNVRPIQLHVAVQEFNRTIWAILIGRPIRNLKNLIRSWSTVVYDPSFWDTNITALIGHKYIGVGSDVPHYGIDNNGIADDVTMGAIPIYSSRKTEERLRQIHEEEWIKHRFEFFGPEFPFRKCPPTYTLSSKPMCAPEECDKCGNTECHFSGHKPDYKDHLGENLVAPFPIRSNEELYYIWMRINNIPENTPLNTDQEAQARGYIEWYRKTYPGTLSAIELENEWRTAGGIDKDKELTPEEHAGLIEYIKSYRSQFLPVLTDRQLEVIWRISNNVPYSQSLSDKQLAKFAEILAKYRDMHGEVPEDSYEVEVVTHLGAPITMEEIEKAGGVTYNPNTIIKLSITIDQYLRVKNGIPPEEKKDPLPADYVPTVYIPELRGFHFCPSFCYYKCGPHNLVDTSAATIDKTSYALSYEFYIGSQSMDPFEWLLYRVIANKEWNPHEVLEIVENYLDWDNETAFYRHLFSLYLINMALHWIRFHD